MSRRSSWISNLAVSAVTLVVAALAGEAVVRVALKDETALFPRYHTDYHYAHYTLRGIRPSSEFTHTSVDGSWRFVTNHQGFRNTKDFAYTKRNDVIRVLSLGDSHTQGYEVRQDGTFSAVLERYLTARGHAAEVMNAGVSGYSTAEELAFLTDEGYRYSPDVVVVGFYANDFDDNLKAGLFGLDAKGALEEKSFEHIPGVRIQNTIYAIPGVQWLSEHSYLYNVAFNGVWVYFKQKLAKETIEYAVGAKEGSSEKEMKLATALLLRMGQYCKHKGIRLIVVDIPEKPGPYRFASSMPEEMKATLASSGIEIIDSEKLLGPLNGAVEFHVAHGHQHISELTHALIGAELGRRILNQADGRQLLVSHP